MNLTKQEIIMLIKKHNSLFGIIVVALIGALVSYGLVSYYYATSSEIGSYTGFIPIQGGYKYWPDKKLNVPDINNPQNLYFKHGVLAWNDNPNGANSDIYVYDFSHQFDQSDTAINVTKSTYYNEIQPATDGCLGNDLVWLSYSANFQDPVIKHQNLVNAVDNKGGVYPIVTASSSKSFLDLDFGRLTWVDNRQGEYNAYMKCHASSATSSEIRLTHRGIQIKPQFSDQYMIWQHNPQLLSPGHNIGYDIYLSNLGTYNGCLALPPSQLTTSTKVISSDISGDKIVWEQFSADPNLTSLFYQRVGSTTPTMIQITATETAKKNPSISGDYIVWTDSRNGNKDIYLYDTANHKEHQITNDPADQYEAVIDDSIIVWIDERNGNKALYSTEIPDNMYDTQPPTMPGNLQAIPLSDKEIKLTWTASSDNVGVDLYNIWRDDQWVWFTTDTSVTASGLTASTTYQFKVDAVDRAYNVSNRASVVATTLSGADTTPPSQPTNLQASLNYNNNVELSWTASTDNIGVTGYNIFRNNELLWQVGSTTSTDHNVEAGQTYNYQVQAVDAAGNESIKSITAGITLPEEEDTTPPSTPVGLSAYYGNNKAYLWWEPATDNVGVIGYGVFKNGQFVWWTTQTAFTLNNISANQVYNFQVFAFDDEENKSDLSTAVKVDHGCAGPYHVRAANGSCVWSCSTGTTPDNASYSCVCKPGYTQTGWDQFGRRVCSQ